MPSLPRAILFDLDDTIISAGPRLLLTQTVAEEYAHLLPMPADEAAKVIEVAAREFWSDETRHKAWRMRIREARIELIEQVFRAWRREAPALTPEVARAFGERFHALREENACFPGAVETIDELRARGVLLALVTNGAAEPQREKVKKFDLARRFHHIQIEGEAGFGKPEERAYRHALEALGVAASDAWMVGDNLEWEVAAPQRLGVFAIWHDHLGEGLPEGSPVRPDRIIRRIPELLE